MSAFEQDPAVAHCAALLRTRGLHAVLAFLNQRTRHRYTGIYAFDPPLLRSLSLYDRENPGIVRGGATPMADSYCSIVGADDEVYTTADAEREPRLNTHPARSTVLAYCGVPLRNTAGECFGTLCHFDLRPRLVPWSEIPILQAVARMLPPFALALFDRGLHTERLERPAMSKRIQIRTDNKSKQS